MLLTVTGQDGSHRHVAVGRHQHGDGCFVLMAGGYWRNNLRGEADVRVTPEGREPAAHTVLEHDPDRAARTLKEMSMNLGRAFSVKSRWTAHPPSPRSSQCLTGVGSHPKLSH